ncbi:glycosyltransferase [Clostridium estertheticum]|uniref:glycosyltransferase n=1 Tax=Clostridium estertheticum TaxID=238834 RepID=UPI001CF12EC8|nr:glycosyltransferase [Clostridium estertheticum]MCB2356992.1 glycosyltransferase [Clostridium estertheticum]WAG42238.1 glycosyltransferase [Clostridium estertheticum]
MIESRKTSIIILTYNNLIYNHICIDSIRKYTKENTYEIIVVDNNSSDGTREWLKEQKDIKVILNDENVGFPKGCNIGIAASDKENDILFLNNDTVVTPRWLDNLKIALYSDDKLGAAASITNNCSNYQSVRVPYIDVKDMIPFADDNNISDPNKWEEKTRLVAFCMIVKRDVLNIIGHMDERFTPGNFEDDDLCMRIIEAGYKMILCNDSFIHHFGSSSFNKDSTKFNNLLKENRKKIEDKWGFNPNVASTLKFDIIERINEPKGKRLNILEFDCGLGATLLKLKYMYPNSEIYGIETNESLAKLGGKVLELMESDFEVDYCMRFKEDKINFFDYIILGNRLQLSKDPWRLLNEIKRFLKPGGYIIATIPNLMHHSVIKELLKGSFMYNENSIINRSNNKFFTLPDICKIFHECGYINQFIFHYSSELTQEDNKLLNSICSIVGEDLRAYFLSYEYVAKYQKSV